MGYSLELYDALVGINVPKEKASAVVTAIEHTLSAELATKADLALLRADFGHLRADVMQQFAIERERTDRSIAALDAKIDSTFATLDAKIDSTFATLDSKINNDIAAQSKSFKADMLELEHRLTLRLGGMMAAMLGLLFVALRFT